MARPLASRAATLVANLDILSPEPRAEHRPGGFAIALDTREQRLGAIDLSIPIVVGKLPAGDLSVVGHEGRIAIDRKAIDDFCGCLTSARERFDRMLEKLSTYDCAAILVETTLQEVERHRYRSRISPQFVVSSAATIAVKYGVPVYFTGPLDVSTDFAIRLLRSWWRTFAEPEALRALEKEIAR